jgi:hypothetical protein
MPDNLGIDDLRQNSKRQHPLSSGLPDTESKRVGRLEREDIVILVLSTILVVATIWLATRVL